MIEEIEELREWLDEQLKDIPEDVKDISFLFPGEGMLKLLKESEKYKGKTFHFFSSSWVKEPQLIWKDDDIPLEYYLLLEGECESREL